VGHAQARDAASARAALRAARADVETRHDDDPPWLAFYGAADYACHEYRVALALGDLPAAADAARAALAAGSAQAAAYPRNHALDLTNLAAVLAQRGECDEAAAVASEAAEIAVHLDSARVDSALHALAA
jgi:hypothetical protein